MEKTFILLLWWCLINPSLRWGKDSKHQTLSMTRKYVLLEEELFISVKLCSCNQVMQNSISKWHHMWERFRHFRIKYNLHFSKDIGGVRWSKGKKKKIFLFQGTVRWIYSLDACPRIPKLQNFMIWIPQILWNHAFYGKGNPDAYHSVHSSLTSLHQLLIIMPQSITWSNSLS